MNESSDLVMIGGLTVTGAACYAGLAWLGSPQVALGTRLAAALVVVAFAYAPPVHTVLAPDPRIDSTRSQIRRARTGPKAMTNVNRL